MPKQSKHPHVSWRDGRPRFNPDQNLRAAGWKARDLRHDDGRWFSRGEAVDWSESFVAELQAQRKKPARNAAALPERVRHYTVGRLFEEWFRSPKFILPATPAELARARAEHTVYSPKTIREYRQKARVIEQHDSTLWASPVDALSQPVMLGLYEELVAARGRATAHGTILTFSSALAWGKRRGKFSYKANLGVNPALDLGMPGVATRMRFGSRAEISALTATADALGWHDMGDMLTFGVWTGQRQEDRLLMVDKGLLNGRRIFRQAKTGAIVAVREAPELFARMKASAERRKAANVINPRVVLDEQTWAPFPDNGDRYRKRFAVLRSFAAAGIVDLEATEAMTRRWRQEGRNTTTPVVWKVAPCPSLLGDAETGLLALQEADCRSTYVTWAALAGATIPEICAVSGHTLASATNILKHYLVLHPEMADSAIGKMVAWYEADGDTELGL